MTCNLGTSDRIVRLLLGLGLLTAGALARSWWGLLGVIPLWNAAVGWCGLYQLLGLSSVARRP